MNKLTKRIVKLLDFLIRVLTKAVNAGIKILEDVQIVADKSSKIGDILQELLKLIAVLQEKRKKLIEINGKDE